MTRLRVYFSGHVQGVGFRYTTHRIAQQYAITGFVMNLADGRVCCEAEGQSDEVVAFVEEVQDRMGNYLKDTRKESLTATYADAGFMIAYEK